MKRLRITTENAFEQLHIASEEIKKLKKEFGVPNRARNIYLINAVVKKHGMCAKHFKRNYKYEKGTYGRVVSLLSHKIFIEGFIEGADLRKKIKKIISCKCGRWYNTSILCPDCGTIANKKYNEN